MLTLRKIHRTSAILLLIFAVMHLANHLVALGGPDLHIAVMQVLRLVYRNPIVEPVLLVAAAGQAVTGLTLFWKLRHAAGNRLAKIQRYSGLILSYFLVSHVIAALYSRSVQQLDTNFYWAASVLVQRPYAYYYAPYYALGVAAFGTHVALALRTVFARRWSRQSLQRLGYGLIAVSLSVALIVVVTFSGALYQIILPHIYTLP